MRTAAEALHCCGWRLSRRPNLLRDLGHSECRDDARDVFLDDCLRLATCNATAQKVTFSLALSKLTSGKKSLIDPESLDAHIAYVKDVIPAIAFDASQQSRDL